MQVSDKVRLDADWAILDVGETKALNRAVKRNRERFPEDFLFPLTPEEAAELLRHQTGGAVAGIIRYTCLPNKASRFKRF